MVASDHLSATFSALADPTRRRMLSRLTEGEMTVAELAEPFELSPPGISKHLKVLERAGLIERGRNAQWRPCKLRAQPLSEVADWIDNYRRFWEESFDRLDDYLRELQAKQAAANEAVEPPEPEEEPDRDEPPRGPSPGIDESHW